MAQEEHDVAQAAIAPVISGERFASLDFIRGIAVMGILAANIVAFGQPWSAYLWPDAFLVPANDPGGWLWIGQLVLVDGKMRGLFTLLFGAGMMLFVEKAWANGSGRWLQFRRLVWLLLFGLVHYFLIWRGDILTSYAMIGAVALLCLRWKAKTQFIVGLLGYVVGAALYAAMMVPLPFIADTPMGEQPAYAETRANLETGKQDALSDDAAMASLKTAGDYVGLTTFRAEEHAQEIFVNSMMFVFETLPLMLIGVALFRFGLFNGEMSSPRIRRWAWAGLLIGIALHVAIGLWVKAGGFTYYGTLAGIIGASPLPRLPMLLGMAVLLSDLGNQATGWLGQRISAAGRAAFTNYLGTSVVMMLVFHGWALGLFGKLDRPQLYLVVLLAWVVMLAWSKPWLERFRFGPLEWLWRCLTYGKLFPLRR